MAKSRRHDIVKPSKFKTSLCQFFQSEEGCPFGDNCAFAHGEAELRPEDVPAQKTTAAAADPTEEESGSKGTTKVRALESNDGESAAATTTPNPNNNNNNNNKNKPNNRNSNNKPNHSKGRKYRGNTSFNGASSPFMPTVPNPYLPLGAGHEPYYNINSVHAINMMPQMMFQAAAYSTPSWYPSEDGTTGYMNYFVPNPTDYSQSGNYLYSSPQQTNTNTNTNTNKKRAHNGPHGGGGGRVNTPIVSNRTMGHISNSHHPVPSAAVNNNAILSSQFGDPIIAEHHNHVKNISLPPNTVLLDGTANIPQNFNLQSLLASDAPPTVVHIPLDRRMQVPRDPKTSWSTPSLDPNVSQLPPDTGADSNAGDADYENWSAVIEQLLRAPTESKEDVISAASRSEDGVSAAGKSITHPSPDGDVSTDDKNKGTPFDFASLLSNLSASTGNKPVVLSLGKPVPLAPAPETDSSKDGVKTADRKEEGNKTAGRPAARKGLLCAVRRGDAALPAPSSVNNNNNNNNNKGKEETGPRRQRAKVSLVSNHFKQYSADKPKATLPVPSEGEEGSDCILLYYADKNTLVYITKPGAGKEGVTLNGEEAPPLSDAAAAGVVPIRCRRPSKPKKLVTEGEVGRDEETEYCI